MTRTDRRPDFDTSFPAALAMTWPMQATMGRRFDRGAAQSTRGSAELGWIGRAVEAVLVWQQRARERRQLMQLSEHMLRDIGVSRASAAGEAAKPFWRI